MTTPIDAMAQVYVLYCDRAHSTTATGTLTDCPTANRHEVVVELETLTGPSNTMPALDATDVAQVFGVGFSIVVLFFLVGRGMGSVLSLIRRG